MTDAHADALVLLVREFLGEHQRELVYLEPARRRGMLRMPPRSGPIFDQIVRLARQHGLLREHVGTSRVERRAAFATRLGEPAHAVGMLHQTLVDSLRVAEADAWSEATALYSALSAIARVNASLLHALRPARAFFKKRRKGRGTKAPPSK